MAKEKDWLAEVKKDGMALKDVPEKFKTAAICLADVRQNKWALKYVPKNLQEKVKKALNK